MNVELSQFENNMTYYIDLAQKGEEVIICRKGKPIIKLCDIELTSKRRPLGDWKGKVSIADDFDSLPDEFMKHFQ